MRCVRSVSYTHLDVYKRQVLVNGTDIWTEYGVFLVEDRRGGMENLLSLIHI